MNAQSVMDEIASDLPTTNRGEEVRIRVRDLVKTYQRIGGEPVPAVAGVSFDVVDGELLVLLGPSGCGKTTLLRCLSGLESADGGTVELSGRVVTDLTQRIDLPPEKRSAGMLFQSYALWPHMTVFDNVAYPLRNLKGRTPSKAEIRERVASVLETVHCDHLAEQYPGEISGGQQQRVALARALVRNDGVIFFDEPLSNVDAKMREQLRVDLRLLQQSVGFAAIYVTHDQIEAMTMADRVAVLREGVIAQLGTPAEIYNHPVSAYVARFMGAVNELPGVAVAATSTVRVTTDLGEVTAPASAGAVSVGDGVRVLCRPSACQVSRERPASDLSWEATVAAVIFVGTHVEVIVDVAGHQWTAWAPAGTDVAVGSTVWFSMTPERLMTVPDDGGDQ